MHILLVKQKKKNGPQTEPNFFLILRRVRTFADGVSHTSGQDAWPRRGRTRATRENTEEDNKRRSVCVCVCNE